MKNNIKIAVILALVAGLSGLLIAALNLFTGPIIEENQIKKEENACLEIYSDAVFTQMDAPADSETILKIFEAKINDKVIGYIYKVSGKNAYGKIEILVGINVSGTIEDIVLTENTQSYAQVVNGHVESSYISGLDTADVEDIDVKCGATFGAKLVKSLVSSAVEHFQKGQE